MLDLDINDIGEDGSLSLCKREGYIAWTPGETITLDGHFTADDLRALANHMDKYTERSQGKIRWK